MDQNRVVTGNQAHVFVPGNTLSLKADIDGCGICSVARHVRGNCKYPCLPVERKDHKNGIFALEV